MAKHDRLTEVYAKVIAQRSWTALLVMWVGIALIAWCSSSAVRATAEPVRLPAGEVAEFSFASEQEVNSLAIGSEGSIWFSQEGTGQIDRMTPDGVLDGKFELATGEGKNMASAANSIDEVMSGPDGDIWFVNNATNSESHYLIGDITTSGEVRQSPVSSSSIDRLVMAPDGTLWFSSSFAIWHITLLEGIVEFPLAPDETELEMVESAWWPELLTAGPEGNTWFTDAIEGNAGLYRVGFITPEGRLEQWQVPPRFGLPTAIAVGPEGDMWFTEYPSGVGRVSPSGKFTEFLTPDVGGLGESIVLGPDGNMWFTESDDALGRITPSGEVTSFGPVLPEGETPALLTADANGNLWYSQAGAPSGGVSHMGRLKVPLEPSNRELPSVSGAASVGQTLTATDGSWSNEPTTIEYQWQACATRGDGCHDIVGQTAVTHTLSTAEVGATLRVLVRARNIAGAASAVSADSSVVTGVASLSSPTQVAGPHATRPPELPSSAKLYYDRHPRYLLVEKVTVAEAPSAGWIDVLCHGRGCPFSRRRIAVTAACHKDDCSPKARDAASVGLVSLRWPFGHRRLSVGTSVTVDVGEAGWIGKSVGLFVRYRHIPGLPSSCLKPDSDVVTDEC